MSRADAASNESGSMQSGRHSIMVKHDLIGMLIGKGGETIKMISRDSAARIEICKDEDQGDKRTVYLYGSADQVRKAKHMIEDTLSHSRERRGGRSRSRSRSGERGN